MVAKYRHFKSKTLPKLNQIQNIILASFVSLNYFVDLPLLLCASLLGTKLGLLSLQSRILSCSVLFTLQELLSC